MTRIAYDKTPAARAAWIVLLLSALASGCGEKTDALTLTVVKAGSDLGDNPLEDVTTLRIRALNDAYAEVGSVELDPLDGSADFSDLFPTTGVFRFQAEGLNGQAVVARGGSAYVSLGGGDIDVALFMGRTNSFHPTMRADRSNTELPFTLAGHTATRLKDGRVLIVGGATLDTAGGITDISNKVLLWDPNTGEYEELSSALRIRRAFHTATLLKAAETGGTQQVLIAGGISLISGERLESTRLAEIFDPVSMSFTGQLVEMRKARYGHTATLLVSGDVLVAGGCKLAAGQEIANRPSTDDLVCETVHADADLFRFSQYPQAFAADTCPLDQARMFHIAGRGQSQLVLIAGGQSSTAVHATTVVYNPDAGGVGSATAGADLITPRSHATLTRLGDGTLLIVGGVSAFRDASTATNSVEIYTLGDVGPGTTEEAPIESRLINRRWKHHAVLMSDNQQVLISGGLDPGGVTLSSAELVTVGSSTVATPVMPHGRVHHTSVRLLSSEVFLVGGVSVSHVGGVELLLDGTIYTPELAGD